MSANLRELLSEALVANLNSKPNMLIYFRPEPDFHILWVVTLIHLSKAGMLMNRNLGLHSELVWRSWILYYISYLVQY